MTKARFPSWIVVVTSVSNALITLAIFSFTMTCFIALFQQVPSLLAFALFLFYQLNFLLIVIGFSLAASVLFLRFRDLNQVWEVALQAGFFIAPIIYPLDILPEKFHFFLFVWPPTPIIQFSRSVLVEGIIPTAEAHFLLVGVTALILTCGIFLYRQLAERAAEYL